MCIADKLVFKCYCGILQNCICMSPSSKPLILKQFLFIMRLQVWTKRRSIKNAQNLV